MKFNRVSNGRQSCFDQRHPEKLVFNYTKMMMASLYLNPHPNQILIVGLGGGTLPSTLRALFPKSSISVAEIDPVVTDMATRFFNFRADDKLKVYEQDGRVFVKNQLRQRAQYDLIVLDAFDENYIPEHMLTREFLTEVRGLLSEGGVLAANTFSGNRLYDNESATYFDVFGDFFGLERNNRVILVQKGGLPALSVVARHAEQVESLLRPLGTGRDELLPLIKPAKPWPPSTRILTDQYSPSNLLNQR